MKKIQRRFLFFILAGILLLSGCSRASSDEVIAKIDGREVMKSEYMVYLYTTTQSFVSTAGDDVWSMNFDGQTGDELVQERAFSTLQSVIAAEDYAQKNGVELTDTQKQEVQASVDEFLAGITPEDLEKIGITEKQLYDLMESSYLYSLVYESLAKECAVDDVEVQSDYADERLAEMTKKQTVEKVEGAWDDLETFHE